MTGKNTKLEPIKLHFISKFYYYDREEDGRKPYTIREISKVTKSWEKGMKLAFSVLNKRPIDITIRRGYTKRCFTTRVTDMTIWKKDIIFAWNPRKVVIHDH